MGRAVHLENKGVLEMHFFYKVGWKLTWVYVYGVYIYIAWIWGKISDKEKMVKIKKWNNPIKSNVKFEPKYNDMINLSFRIQMSWMFHEKIEP